MTDPNAPSASPLVATNAPAFFPWHDEYGREHPSIPRCVGETRPRDSRSRWRTYHECKRKGVVQRGVYAGREAWFCLQHDPRRQDERRLAALAPQLLDLVREALELMPATKRARDWRRRAEGVVDRSEGSARSDAGLW